MDGQDGSIKRISPNYFLFFLRILAISNTDKEFYLKIKTILQHIEYRIAII